VDRLYRVLMALKSADLLTPYVRRNRNALRLLHIFGLRESTYAVRRSTWSVFVTWALTGPAKAETVMYERILVPTDGSMTATRGVQEAITLAKTTGARIRLLHVIDEPHLSGPQISSTALDALSAQLRQAGIAALASAREMVSAAGISVDTKLIEDTAGASPGEYIVQSAKVWPADLIVCGTHGRRGIRRVVMGSEAEFVVRHSRVPILLVRAEG